MTIRKLLLGVAVLFASLAIAGPAKAQTVCNQTPWKLTQGIVSMGTQSSVSLIAPVNGCTRHLITSIHADLLDSTDDGCAQWLVLLDGSTVVWTRLLATYPVYHAIDHADADFPISQDSGAYGEYGWTVPPITNGLTVKFNSTCSNSLENITVTGFDIPCNGDNGGNAGAC
jgi:hypothetical protein